MNITLKSELGFVAKAEGELPSQVFVPPTPIYRGFLCYSLQSLQLYLIVHSIFHIFVSFSTSLFLFSPFSPVPINPQEICFKRGNDYVSFTVYSSTSFVFSVKGFFSLIILLAETSWKREHFLRELYCKNHSIQSNGTPNRRSLSGS